MAWLPQRSFLLTAVLLVLLSGMSGTAVAADDPLSSRSSVPSSSASTNQPGADINASLRQLASSARGSRLATVLEGKRVNVRVKRADGSTVTKGLAFEPGQGVSVEQGGFTSPDLTTGLSEATLKSIAASPDSTRALEKAVKYDLVTVRATGAGDRFITSLATQGTKLGGRSRIASARVDLDDDPQTDAILEIEALRADDGREFDRLVRTVLRDVDDDGKMDTVTSETRPIASTVMGSVDLDLNDDGTRDTLLRLTGEDTNADGQLDRQIKATLVDTRGDPQFDSFTETTEPVAPSTEVTAEWDLNDDGSVNARINIRGEDTDSDDAFERQTLTIALNLDGEPGFESTSSTTARINPTLSISAEFDTDGDGTPDTRASLTATDANDDGGLDSESVAVVNDSDGDGVYDTVVERDEFRRGFISNQGEPIRYLNDPGTLTVIGVLASILSMLLQLVQGG